MKSRFSLSFFLSKKKGVFVITETSIVLWHPLSIHCGLSGHFFFIWKVEFFRRKKDPKRHKNRLKVTYLETYIFQSIIALFCRIYFLFFVCSIKKKGSFTGVCVPTENISLGEFFFRKKKGRDGSIYQLINTYIHYCVFSRLGRARSLRKTKSWISRYFENQFRKYSCDQIIVH